MPDPTQDCIEGTAEHRVDIGDLDLRRNLKIRSFLGLVLAPVFRDLQPQLNYVAMGRRGISPGQYFQDFRSHPAPFGYGNRFHGDYRIRLCRSVSDEPRGAEATGQRVVRLILETTATLTAQAATAPPESLGFEPRLGAPALAGTGRVLHVLTRPQMPPGQRWVETVPHELDFLTLHDSTEPFPTIGLLAALEPGFSEVAEATTVATGIWGVANSDVFQHVHAREYTIAMENAVTASLAAAGLKLESQVTTRARVIFRRPAFIGQRYALRIRLFRREDAFIALGAFHPAGQDLPPDDQRASVFMRFDGSVA